MKNKITTLLAAIALTISLGAGSAVAAPKAAAAAKAEAGKNAKEFKGNIVGTYTVTGNTPGQNGQYTGKVVIKKTDDTYQVSWTLGEESNFGTGLLNGDTFAVAYTNSKGSFFGLVLYKVSPDGRTMEGMWTMAGANLFGTEKLVKELPGATGL